MRSAVSRTAKGYSVEATLDMDSATDSNEETKTLVNALSAFQIAKLREHMEALGKEFPREEGEKP